MFKYLEILAKLTFVRIYIVFFSLIIYKVGLTRSQLALCQGLCETNLEKSIEFSNYVKESLKLLSMYQNFRNLKHTPVILF